MNTHGSGNDDCGDPVGEMWVDGKFAGVYTNTFSI